MGIETLLLFFSICATAEEIVYILAKEASESSSASYASFSEMANNFILRKRTKR